MISRISAWPELLGIHETSDDPTTSSETLEKALNIAFPDNDPTMMRTAKILTMLFNAITAFQMIIILYNSPKYQLCMEIDAMVVVSKISTSMETVINHLKFLGISNPAHLIMKALAIPEVFDTLEFSCSLEYTTLFLKYGIEFLFHVTKRLFTQLSTELLRTNNALRCVDILKLHEIDDISNVLMMVKTIDMNNPIDHIQKRREMAYQALQSHELMKVESALSQCLVSASEHKDEEQTRQYISPVLPFRHLSTPVKSPTSSDFMSSSYSSPLQQNVVMISLHLGYREDITIQLHPPIHAPTMKQLTISAMKQFNISDMVQCTLQPIITPSTTYPINRIPLMLKAVSPHTVLLTTGINVLEEEFYGIFNRLSLSEFEEKFPKKELIFWNANNERINPINLKKNQIVKVQFSKVQIPFNRNNKIVYVVKDQGIEGTAIIASLTRNIRTDLNKICNQISTMMNSEVKREEMFIRAGDEIVSLTDPNMVTSRCVIMIRDRKCILR